MLVKKIYKKVHCPSEQFSRQERLAINSDPFNEIKKLRRRIIKNSFAHLLREHMDEQNITGAEIARQLGCAPKTVYRLVRGQTHRPDSFKTVIALCIILQLTEIECSEFLSCAGYPISSVDPDDFESILYYTATLETNLRTLDGWNNYFIECGASALVSQKTVLI